MNMNSDDARAAFYEAVDMIPETCPDWPVIRDLVRRAGSVWAHTLARETFDDMKKLVLSE